jgi:hypothetical protein
MVKEQERDAQVGTLKTGSRKERGRCECKMRVWVREGASSTRKYADKGGERREKREKEIINSEIWQ